jgi:hypothetical protein
MLPATTTFGVKRKIGTFGVKRKIGAGETRWNIVPGRVRTSIGRKCLSFRRFAPARAGHDRDTRRRHCRRERAIHRPRLLGRRVQRSTTTSLLRTSVATSNGTASSLIPLLSTAAAADVAPVGDLLDGRAKPHRPEEQRQRPRLRQQTNPAVVERRRSRSSPRRRPRRRFDAGQASVGSPRCGSGRRR